ncbi:MAG: peptide deformylase [Gemmatimonadota bacterium]|nr:MAG: peptide deformylase [Gemmatimonadota bacterium]
MAVRPIRLLGDPVLRSECAPIKQPRSPAVRLVADDLRETLSDLRQRYGFGRGLASPQIGAPMRVIHIEAEESLTMLNPQILDIGNQDFSVWDDCFSIPELFVRVSRAYRIKIGFQDLQSTRHKMEFEGELAALIQHEIDHLDGVLTVDRPSGLDPFCLREEWSKHYAAEARYGHPVPREGP